MTKPGRGKRGGCLPIVIIALILLGVPLLVLEIQSRRTGMTWSQILGRAADRAGGESTGLEDAHDSSLPPREKIDFLRPTAIGPKADPTADELPLIAKVTAVDLDADGLLDIVVCDDATHRVSWIRQESKGVFVEHVLGERIDAPAHAEPVDIDGDGDLDLAVAALGMLNPNNDPIGSVVILLNDGSCAFTNHVVLEKVARVSDLRAGDLDGDGDPDLVLAQFGYDDGEMRWLENRGDLSFESHPLLDLAGAIHCPLTDIDRDGDLDIVALISQEFEEIFILTNDGRGTFVKRMIFGCSNEDFGSSGLSVVDLDADGDDDLLYTNGDAFDYLPPRPREWHGVQWLENDGDGRFVFRRLGNFGGASTARHADVDGDGDLDVVVVSTFNQWLKPECQSMVWFENDGHMRFARRNITNTPTHLLTLDTGDFDGDGRIDFVTGGMNFFPPYDRAGRVTLWLNAWGE